MQIGALGNHTTTSALQGLRGGISAKGIPGRRWHVEGGTATPSCEAWGGHRERELSCVPWQRHRVLGPDLQAALSPSGSPAASPVPAAAAGLGASPVPAHLEPRSAASPRCAGTPPAAQPGGNTNTNTRWGSAGAPKGFRQTRVCLLLTRSNSYTSRNVCVYLFTRTHLPESKAAGEAGEHKKAQARSCVCVNCRVIQANLPS